MDSLLENDNDSISTSSNSPYKKIRHSLDNNVQNYKAVTPKLNNIQITNSTFVANLSAAPITGITTNTGSDTYRAISKGVYKVNGKFKAQIQRKGKMYYLGIYDTEQEAAQAYNISKTQQLDLLERNYRRGISNKINIEKFKLECSSAIPFTTNSPLGIGIAMPYLKISFQSIFNRPSDSNSQLLWERLCQISQRLLLVKAIKSKTSQSDALSQAASESIDREINLLIQLKLQLEQSLSKDLGIEFQSEEILSNFDKSTDDEMNLVSPSEDIHIANMLQSDAEQFKCLDDDDDE